jgi:Zn finger protein HypA/HybF involved in hydrogenase expression
MIEQEPEAHICYECDAEFVIHTPFDTDQKISFCPFCGSEMEDDFDEDDDEEEEERFD